MSLKINSRVSIPLGEIELRTAPSSGPGGQHANRSETRVEAVFRIAESEALSEAQKRRVTEKLGPVVTAVAQDQRSQLRNREMALERLTEKLAKALKVQAKRTPTKPSRASTERRIAAKKLRGEVKTTRRRPTGEE